MVDDIKERIEGKNPAQTIEILKNILEGLKPVSYTHLRAHETVLDLVCRLLLEKKKKQHTTQQDQKHISTHNK